MRTTWRLIGLYAVLAAALTATPALAGADSDTPKSKDLAEIEKRLDQRLDRIVAALERLEGVKKDIRDLREDLTYQRMVKIPSLEQDIRDLQQQVVRLTEEINRQRSSTSARTSFFAGPGPAIATGTLRLRNTYMEPVTIAVNGRLYEVPPGAELSLSNQPAGEFTYEVVGVQPPVRRTLAANKTFAIDVFPR